MCSIFVGSLSCAANHRKCRTLWFMSLYQIQRKSMGGLVQVFSSLKMFSYDVLQEKSPSIVSFHPGISPKAGTVDLEKLARGRRIWIGIRKDIQSKIHVSLGPKRFFTNNSSSPKTNRPCIRLLRGPKPAQSSAQTLIVSPLTRAHTMFLLYKSNTFFKAVLLTDPKGF